MPIGAPPTIYLSVRCISPQTRIRKDLSLIFPTDNIHQLSADPIVHKEVNQAPQTLLHELVLGRSCFKDKSEVMTQRLPRQG